MWTIQAFQSTRGVSGTGSDGDKQPTFAESAQTIIKQDGIRGLWRGLGPALILVINPVIQVGVVLWTEWTLIVWWWWWW